jgi:hypothetical protein
MTYVLTAFVLAYLEAGYGWWVLFVAFMMFDFFRTLP